MPLLPPVTTASSLNGAAMSQRNIYQVYDKASMAFGESFLLFYVMFDVHHVSFIVLCMFNVSLIFGDFCTFPCFWDDLMASRGPPATP